MRPPTPKSTGGIPLPTFHRAGASESPSLEHWRRGAQTHVPCRVLQPCFQKRKAALLCNTAQKGKQQHWNEQGQKLLMKSTGDGKNSLMEVLNYSAECALPRQEVARGCGQLTAPRSHAARGNRENRVLSCILENVSLNDMNLHLKGTADCE